MQTREDEDAEDGEFDDDFVDKEYYPPQSNLEVEDDGLFTKKSGNNIINISGGYFS